MWTEGFFKFNKLNINTEQLIKACYEVRDIIYERYRRPMVNNQGQFKGSTQYFHQYNLFTFAYPELHQLYQGVRELWHKVNPDNGVYYIRSWLNIYEESDSIGWHHHWRDWERANHRAFHGFYGVDVDVSKTSYVMRPEHYALSKEHHYEHQGDSLLEYIDEYEIVNVILRDNFLVMAPSMGDMHRNIPWDQDRPRITIAFDIVPEEFIDNRQWANHWIPL
jgi:hypothetical protein